MHYRVNTTRISDWNYSKEAWYYVTICTKNNVVLFGEVGNENVYLNPLGKFCDAAWRNIPSHYKSVTLDKYVVMPNHLHGIVAINKDENLLLGNIIGGFKSEVKRWANINGYSSFQWQSRFYDHIIRNQEDLNRIQKYICDNPLKWDINHIDI